MMRLGVLFLAVLAFQISWGQPVSELVLGIICPKTGDEIDEGKLQCQSAQLAVNQINGRGGAGGKKVRLEVLDNGSTPAGTVAAYEKLAEMPGMMGIIGPIKSPQMVALAPKIKAAQIPTFSRATLSRLTAD